jgi:hypothetical protein
MDGNGQPVEAYRSEGRGSYPSGCATSLLTVRRVAIGIAGLILLSGCAAEVGQTDLTLHQRAVFPDGTRYELGGFKTSEVDNDRPKGPPKIPGNEVTVSVVVENAGPAIGAGDVAMSLVYRDADGEELVPPVIASGAAVIASGAKGTISKTFRVEDTKELFQTRHLRVRVELSGYPAVTFSGSNP